MRNKILTLIGACVIVFSVAAGVTQVRAGVADNVTGWIWGGSQDSASIYSGLGWISMNNTNPGAGGANSYGVNIPVIAAGGPVTGYAYSENAGAIDFAPHSGCPGSPKYAGACDAYPAAPNSDVTRTGGNLTGWARIVDISKAKAIGNSGTCNGIPCDGWIKMSGPGYGVTINPTTGFLGNFAWSDQFGWISFAGNGASWNGSSCTGANDYGNTNRCNYGAKIPPPPIPDLNADPITIDVDANPNWNVGAGTPVALSWTITNPVGSTCTKSGGAWGGTTSANGSDNVNQNASNVTYRLSCTGPGGGPFDDTANVVSACRARMCDASERCSLSGGWVPASSSATCVPMYTCSADSDCVARSSGEWIEIAP